MGRGMDAPGSIRRNLPVEWTQARARGDENRVAFTLPDGMVFGVYGGRVGGAGEEPFRFVGAPITRFSNPLVFAIGKIE